MSQNFIRISSLNTKTDLKSVPDAFFLYIISTHLKYGIIIIPLTFSLKPFRHASVRIRNTDLVFRWIVSTSTETIIVL